MLSKIAQKVIDLITNTKKWLGVDGGIYLWSIYPLLVKDRGRYGKNFKLEEFGNKT